MAKPRKKFEGVKVVTPTFRASFLTVFEPRAFEEGADPKYSVEMLFDKEKTDLKPMKQKMMQAAVGAWGKDKAKWPKNFKLPWRDGDQKEDAGPEYAGMITLRADSKQPPGVYDQKRNDIINKRDIYSGCFCRASLYIVPYENIGGKETGRSGLKCYLQGIQLVAKGEAFGNAGNSRDDFDELESDEADSGAEDFEDFGDDAADEDDEL